MLSLFLSDAFLSILPKTHSLDSLKGNQSWKSDFHCVKILFDQILFSQPICLRNISQNISSKINLISLKLIAKKSLNNQFPINELKQILNKSFILFDWSFPKINTSWEKCAKSLFHSIKWVSIWCEIKILYFR